MHDSIAKNNKVFSGKDGNAFEIKFDELVALVLRDVGSILLDIYQVFFAQEVKGNTGGMPEEDLWKMNEKNLFEFLKEYDICPSLLSKSVAFQVYLHTKNAKESIYERTGFDVIASLDQRTGTSKRRPNMQEPEYNIGKHFTFFKFLDLITKCAKLTFSGYTTGSES